MGVGVTRWRAYRQNVGFVSTKGFFKCKVILFICSVKAQTNREQLEANFEPTQSYFLD